MWIVRNRLRAIIKIEGTAIEIKPGAEFDLDQHGRKHMEQLLPLAVCFEEGYLENVFKEAESEVSVAEAPTVQPTINLEERLNDFKKSIIDEIRKTAPIQQAGVDDKVLKALLGEHIGAVHEDLRASVKGMMDSLSDVQETLSQRLSEQRKRIVNNPNLSDVEIRARLAVIEETERKIQSNFDQLGHEVEGDDGPSDVLGNADLLSNI